MKHDRLIMSSKQSKLELINLLLYTYQENTEQGRMQDLDRGGSFRQVRARKKRPRPLLMNHTHGHGVAAAERMRPESNNSGSLAIKALGCSTNLEDFKW